MQYFHTQTVTKPYPPDLTGNCMQAAVATLLQLPLEEVPDFINPESVNKDLFWRNLEEFLNKRNLTHVCLGWLLNPKALHIAIGPTTRSKDETHSVVYRGEEMVWDPHPSREGILEVTSRFYVVVLDPTL
jgi:hypothetical protein